MNLPPVPSETPGSASRIKAVYKSGEKWMAQIRILSEGGQVHLGTFDSEEEAGIMYARARYKYSVHQDNPVRSKRSRRSVDHSEMQATQREPALGESDEVDGIVIEAFADPSRLEPCSLGPGESPRPQSQSRPKKRSKSHRTRTRTGTARQRQARPPQPARQRPYRHQLFSGRVESKSKSNRPAIARQPGSSRGGRGQGGQGGRYHIRGGTHDFRGVAYGPRTGE